MVHWESEKLVLFYLFVWYVETLSQQVQCNEKRYLEIFYEGMFLGTDR